MNKPKNPVQKFQIKKISLKLALFFGLIEAIALFFIAILKIDTKTTSDITLKIIGGFLTGILTTLITLTIINLLLLSKKIKFSYNNSQIKKISLTAPSILNGIFLALLFSIESSISDLKKINIIMGNSIVAFILMLLLIPLLLLLYNALPSSKLAKITFKTDKDYMIAKISPKSAAIFAIIYEIIALPIMAYLDQKQFLYNIIGQQLGFSFIGLISGILASLIAIVMYNKFQKTKLSLDITS